MTLKMRNFRPTSTSSCTKSWHQIIFNSFFLRFPWSTFFPLPFNLQFHYFTYLWISASTDDMTISLQTAMYLTATPTLSPRISLETLSTSFTSHIALIICCSTPHSLNSSTIVSSQVSLLYERTFVTQDCYILTRCFIDKPYFPTKTPPNSVNFQALPIFAMTASDAPP